MSFVFCLLLAVIWAEGYYSPGKLVANLENPAITESSGLATSRLNPDIFWTHNDSGDGPILYAFDRKGKAVATMTVKEARAVDWEDMAAGPGQDGKPALYIGDIGDNELKRSDTCVYRIPEPSLDLSKAPLRRETAPAAQFPFLYPDGHHDAETLMVHPETGDIYIVTKEITGIAGVYRFANPPVDGKKATLKKAASLSFPDAPLVWGAVTGGDIAPDGRRVVLRVNLAAYEYRLPPGKPFDTIFSTKPVKITLPQEQQGEAIAYRADGKALLTTSEKRPTPLHEMVWVGSR